jgi:hypothetical protein
VSRFLSCSSLPREFDLVVDRRLIPEIPRAAVQHHISLHSSPSPSSKEKSASSTSATNAQHAPNSPLASPSIDKTLTDNPHNHLSSPSPGITLSNGRLSPLPIGMRKSSNPAGTAASTRVIDSLQTELLAAKGHVERMKQEMRSSQRVIGSVSGSTSLERASGSVAELSWFKLMASSHGKRKT